MLGLNTLWGMESKYKNHAIQGDFHMGYGIGLVLNADISGKKFVSKKYHVIKPFFQTEIRYRNSGIIFNKTDINSNITASHFEFEPSVILKFAKQYEDESDFDQSNFFLQLGCNLNIPTTYDRGLVDYKFKLVNVTTKAIHTVIPMLSVGIGMESINNIGKIQISLNYSNSLSKNYNVTVNDQLHDEKTISSKNIFYDYFSIKVNYLFSFKYKKDDSFIVNPRF
ncbi:MAG: hypothetical protein U0T32_09785 [Chitinophagales bacterium]